MLREIAEEATNQCGYGDAVLEEVEAIVLATERRIAALSTPTPGRAAEPDTMGEVERLALSLVGLARANPPGSDDQPKQPEADALSALLSAVRTIVTERDDAENLYDDVWAQLIAEQQNSGRLRARAETAEAQLATLRAGVEKAKVSDQLRQLSNAASPDWCVYSEPDVGLPPSLFSGQVGQMEFGPIEPLQGYDLLLAEAAVNFVRTLLSTSGADR